jgi:thiamine-phosphate pyrophosphorylase
MLAAEEGADYVMFGAQDVALATTEDRVRWSAELFELPCVAYARDMSEIVPLVAAGADFIALDYVWLDPRGPAQALREAAEHLRLPEPAQ